MNQEGTPYVPKVYLPGAIKEAVRARRIVKEHTINLSGRKSADLKAITDTAHQIVGLMQRAHGAWIKEKIDDIYPYLESHQLDAVDGKSPVESNPLDTLKAAFMKGLDTAITQEYKVAETAKPIIDSNRLDEIITGYAFDFYLTLRACRRFGVVPNTALQIAQLAYHHNPNVLTELYTDDRFKSLKRGVIVRAVLNSPKDPEKFLNGFIARIAELSKDERFKGLSPSVIQRAALKYPKNPAEFLNWFIVKIAELRKDDRFNHLNSRVITSAVLNSPKDPEGFLNGFIARIAKLSKDVRFKGLSPSVIEHAALYHPNDAERILLSIQVK